MPGIIAVHGIAFESKSGDFSRKGVKKQSNSFAFLCFMASFRDPFLIFGHSWAAS
jgi:hypothetical protein